jgi:hypothetical protein
LSHTGAHRPYLRGLSRSDFVLWAHRVISVRCDLGRYGA